MLLARPDGGGHSSLFRRWVQGCFLCASLLVRFHKDQAGEHPGAGCEVPSHPRGSVGKGLRFSAACVGSGGGLVWAGVPGPAEPTLGKLGTGFGQNKPVFLVCAAEACSSVLASPGRQLGLRQVASASTRCLHPCSDRGGRRRVLQAAASTRVGWQEAAWLSAGMLERTESGAALLLCVW